REDLPGVGAALRVEDRAHALHERDVVGREGESELGELLDTDAVLARHAAAELDARRQDLASGGKRARRLVRIALVVQHYRMDVAVAGVEHVADAEAVARTRRLDAGEDVRKA